MTTLNSYEATPTEELEQFFVVEMLALASRQHEPTLLQLQPTGAFVLIGVI